MNSILPYLDLSDLLAPEATWRRHVAAVIAELAGGVGISWAMSAVVTPIILATSSAAIAWCVFVLGALLTLAATLYSAGVINRYIYNRRIDHDFAAARRTVCNFIDRVCGRLTDIDSTMKETV